MSRATELVQFVLAGQGLSHEQALGMIDTALVMEVDVLTYLSRQSGLSEDRVYERAAQWAGATYSPKIPLALVRIRRFARIDMLGQVRSLRANLDGREVLFTGPTFESLLRLKALLDRHPERSRHVCVVPPSAIVRALASASKDLLLDESRQRLARIWPQACAHLVLTKRARRNFVLMVIAFSAFAALPINNSLVFLPASLLFLLAPALLRLLAVGAPDSDVRRPRTLLGDDDLPVYTVLIPLRDEARMVPALARSMLAMDYPAEKLDVKFVVEAGSVDTLAAVERIVGTGPFELVAVPDSLPRTKPKALNYAIPFVRGEHLVVYDAEDIPDPDQLRLAASRFAAEPEVSCLQAALIIDNAHETALTALFASEYAGLFSVMLPALARWNLPMPLGGTSNHFRVADLKAAGAWDAFNVTEDADLGIRLARMKFRSAILGSATREEAPLKLRAWMRQRTRWMKGWMQTLIVHNRHPLRFLRDTGWRSFLAFEIYMGGIVFAPLLHTIFLVVALAHLLVPGFRAGPDVIWTSFNMTILATGYCGAVALVVRGLWRQGQRHLLIYQFLLPFYWVLHSVATVRALVELLHRPYFWAKTAHGRTNVTRDTALEHKRMARLRASIEV
jgi:cellulose synthase/poly-beta-1,6-N-acetylglucosamine synthase-like glycosyltransferase